MQTPPLSDEDGFYYYYRGQPFELSSTRRATQHGPYGTWNSLVADVRPAPWVTITSGASRPASPFTQATVRPVAPGVPMYPFVRRLDASPPPNRAWSTYPSGGSPWATRRRWNDWRTWPPLAMSPYAAQYASPYAAQYAYGTPLDAEEWISGQAGQAGQAGDGLRCAANVLAAGAQEPACGTDPAVASAASAWLDRAAAQPATRKTVRRYRDPIVSAAQHALAHADDPSVGCVAQKLAGPVVDAATATGERRTRARRVLAVAERAAHTEPTIAGALVAARSATGQAASACHAAQTAADAARGEPRAAREVHRLREDAVAGDPAAQHALALMTASVQGTETSPVVGAAHASRIPKALRTRAQHAAVQAAEEQGATALGVVVARGGAQGGAVSVATFASADEADDWLGSLDARTFAYAAYYDAEDPTWPYPVNEIAGTVARPARPTTVSGWGSEEAAVGALGALPWLGLGLGVAGLYWWLRSRQDAAQGEPSAPGAPAPPLLPSGIAQWWDRVVRGTHAPAAPAPTSAPTSASGDTMTGAELDVAKADSVAAVSALRAQVPDARYFGYLRSRVSQAPTNVRPGTRVVMQDLTVVVPLATEEDLWAWYREETADPDAYELVALFDTQDPAWPNPVYAHEPPRNPQGVSHV